ncbi:MAG: hypothetical protein ACXVC6_11125 [Bacteroidia bacterium]
MKRFFFNLFLFSTICLKLSAYELKLSVPFYSHGQYKFSILNFIDARLGKEKPVGFTRVGISNKTEGIFLPKDFESNCGEIFSKPEVGLIGARKLIAVINQLTVQETHGGGWEYSTVSLGIDYYLLDSNSYNLYYRSFIKTAASNGFDITKKHAENLEDAFMMSFDNLNNFFTNGGKAFEYSHIPSSVLMDSVFKQTNQKITGTGIKNGVFYSCKQVALNTPQKDLWNFLASIDTSKNEIYFPDRASLPNGNALFGFAKDNVLYVHIKKDTYHKAGLVDSTKLGYFKDVTRSKVATGAVVASAVLSGLFGFAGSIMGSGIKSSSVKIQRVDKLYFDLESGLWDIEP